MGRGACMFEKEEVTDVDDGELNPEVGLELTDRGGSVGAGAGLENVGYLMEISW